MLFAGPMHMASSANRTCKRIAVRLRIHGYGANPQIPAGANHAQSDFATVGNQDLSGTCYEG